MSERIQQVRRAYAERLSEQAGLRSPGLREAFAQVPREAFVGPGPWQILRPEALDAGYEQTPDANPERLYDRVLVALDAARHLNNGEPASVARWLDALDLSPGDRFLHVGCGVGYYTAVAAHVVGPEGRGVGLEVHDQLAPRAARNLAGLPNVVVRHAGSPDPADGLFDAIFVNAGATNLLPSWLGALAPGGRLLVPLTVTLPGRSSGVGHMLRVQGGPGERMPARFVSFVGIYPCEGARSEPGERALHSAYARGGEGSVRSLRRDAHAATPGCWMHTDSLCLSREPAPGSEDA